MEALPRSQVTNVCAPRTCHRRWAGVSGSTRRSRWWQRFCGSGLAPSPLMRCVRKGSSMDVPWAVTPEKVERAVRTIVETSHPRKVVLFGSYVRGRLHRNSDLDVLVVTADEVENPRKESVRIRRALKGIGMPVDILVVSAGVLARIGDAPGLIYREALAEGVIAYESSA